MKIEIIVNDMRRASFCFQVKFHGEFFHNHSPAHLLATLIYWSKNRIFVMVRVAKAKIEFNDTLKKYCFECN